MAFIQTDQINTELADEYIKTLTNRDIAHEAFVIAFSGPPGSGKTTLTQKLVHDLDAVCVHHDTIRMLATKHGYNTREMSMAGISRIVVDRILTEDKNKLIVLDSSIDRSWTEYVQYISSHSVNSFLIRLDVPYDIVYKRLLARDGPKSIHIEMIETFMQRYEECKLNLKADVTLAERYDYDMLLGKLKRLISS